MKLNIISISFFIFLGFFSLCFGADSLESLRSTYSIENNILTTATGKKYPRNSFESRLHFNLCYYMKDPKAVEVVYKAYKKNILPVLVNLSEDGLSNGASEAFSKALIETCLLFGNPKESPEKSFICALRHEGSYGLKWIEEYSEEIRDFIEEANTPIYSLPVKKKSKKFKIVIITTTASGGNHSVAESMAMYLSKMLNIEPILIDVEEVARSVDPVMMATNTYTYDMIYSSIFQKTNDFSVIAERKKLNREIQQYIPSTILSELKKKIIKLNPDLIISIRAYTCDDIGLASLGIPFRMLHTDFELCTSLSSYYRSVFSDSIRFWLPICRPSMFKPLFEVYKQLDSYSEKDDYPKVLKKMSNFLNIPQGNLEAQFEVIGCPSFHFFGIEDHCLLDRLREKWGIKEKEMPIFIVMGKHGTHSIREIFDQLISAKTKLPLKYIFICGKNKSLKKELEIKLQSSNSDKFIIQGLLSPEEMNEIMNISFLGISKAGGATVMESLAVKRHLLLMHSYPWEEINASYLTEVGLGTKYDPTKLLIEQIENCMQNHHSNAEKLVLLENWQNNLMLQIETCKTAQ